MRTRTTLFALTTLAFSGACRHAGPAVDGSEPARIAAGTDPQGVAAFSRHSKFVGAKLSTKGTYFALVTLENGKRSLTFIERATGKMVSRFQDPDSMVGTFYWANDDRVVIDLVDQEGALLAQPVNYGEIYAVDATGRGGKLLFGYRAGAGSRGFRTSLRGNGMGSRGQDTRVHQAEPDRAWGWVVSTLRDDPGHVLIAASDWAEALDHTVRLFKLDVYSGTKTLVTVSPLPSASFLVDELGEPRIAAGRDANYKPRFFYRDPGGSWRELSSLPGLTPTSIPVHFNQKDRSLIVVDPTPDGFGLFAVDLDKGDRKLLSHNDIVPPSGFIIDRATNRIVAAEYQADLPSYDVLVPEHPLNRLIAGVAQSFPGEHVELASRTLDNAFAILRVYSDQDPGQFLLADVAKSSVEPLVAVRPWIKPSEMAEMTAFHIPTSDGLQIHGFLTQPRSPAQGPFPLVVLPHGGPHGVRDYWAFDAEAQLLASNGFAVLQVNYRGSGGYGLAYQEAGYRKWGGRVVEDIIDATRFAVRKGYADPQRICIYGASFGGYAAMQSAIVAPDLFRCAVGYAGVYDLTRETSVFLGRLEETRALSDYAKTAIGDDADALKASSPLFHADKLVAKVLLIHGEKDKVAAFAHAEALKKALTEKGNPPAWLVEPNEAHGFYDEGARERMYTQLLLFLKANTQPKPTPVAP